MTRFVTRKTLQILLVLLLVASGALHYAARQKIIYIQGGDAEFVNTTLFLLCGVLSLVTHFLQISGRAWYFGLIGLSMATIFFEGLRELNMGLLFMTSTFLVIFAEAVLTKTGVLPEQEAEELQ